MLKARVIPTLLWKDGSLVKGTGFDSWRRIGAAMPAIKVYNTRDVDELVLMDITATAESRGPDLAEIDVLARECFVPFTVGGGVASVEMVRDLLRAGADKVIVNSAAYANPALVSEAALRFGSQCVVAAIDALRGDDGGYECCARSGTLRMGIGPVQWAKRLEALGAGEILLTRIERDGTLQGYDVDLLALVTAAVSIPVIAAGGAGSYDDMLRALRTGGASAVAAGAMFQFTEQTPREAKRFLAAHGVPVRAAH
jgi:cyclase